MAERGNLKIVGDSGIISGSYGKVGVVGTLNVREDLEAAEMSVTGTCEAGGDIVCGRLKVLGELYLRKLTVTDQANILGVVTAAGVVGEQVKILGEVKCTGDFECSGLEIRGAVHVDGLLNVEHLSIKSHACSSARETGGKSIRIRQGHPLSWRVVFRADTIEFDEVDIEYVQAKIVRGNNLVIGPNCNIEVAEYSGTIECHPDARIGQIVKI